MPTIKKYINNFFSFIAIILFTVTLTLSIIVLSPFKYYEYSDYTEHDNVTKKSNILPLFSFGKSSKNDVQSINNLEYYKKLYENAIDYITTEILSRPDTIDSEKKYTADNYDDITELEDKEDNESDSDNIKKHKLPTVEQQLTKRIRKKSNVNILKKETSINAKTAPAHTPVESAKNKTKESDYFIEEDNFEYSEEDQIIDEIDVVSIDEQLEEIVDINQTIISEKNPEQYQSENMLVVENNTSFIIIDPSEDDISGNSFNSNPCDSEAARYISRCIRLRRSNRN